MSKVIFYFSICMYRNFFDFVIKTNAVRLFENMDTLRYKFGKVVSK